MQITRNNKWVQQRESVIKAIYQIQLLFTAASKNIKPVPNINSTKYVHYPYYKN